MRTILELAKDIKEIYEEVLILQNSMEKKDIDIDFQKINAIASKNPIENHYISKLDEYTQKVYFTYLCKVINITNDDSTKYSQIQFMSRIISSIKNPHFDTKEILLSSVSNQMDLGEFVKCISDKLLDVFIVDNLILAYINGNGENQVIEYVSEIISLFKIENEKFKELVGLARAVLNYDDDGIVEYSKLSDLNKFLCYMKKPYDAVVVYSLEDAKVEKSDKIIMMNVDVENIDKEINLDEFHASEITFINCKFINIKGIKSKNKLVKFCNSNFRNIQTSIQVSSTSISGRLEMFLQSRNEQKISLIDILKCYIYDCSFENCNVSKELISIEEGYISKSIFKECKCVDVDSGTFLISLKNGSIEDIDIEDCSINISTLIERNLTGGLINMSIGSFINSNIINCKVIIDDIQEYACIPTELYMVKLTNARIEGCIFKGCILKGCIGSQARRWYKSYVIGLLNSYEKECKVINCTGFSS